MFSKIPEARTTPIETKIMPKKLKQIIYVGRIVKEKGVDLFVDAIREIYKDFKDWNFKIIGTPRLGINKLDQFSRKIKHDFESLGNRHTI